MALERGEADVGFAKAYYSLRLKWGKSNANIALAFTDNDAGCLIN
jgi:iron(III) transport system substrate-binding protein|tara:strand:+ start:3732 stop:3866 length:135 start_codon:yes stop_codon:yes gene_type:complete